MLLHIDDLMVGFPGRDGWDEAVRGVSLRVDRGEMVGLVGESGSGKTLTALSVPALLPENAKKLNGEVRIDGVDILTLEEEQRRLYRGARVGFIFQEPEAALNPVFTVGFLLSETLRQHRSSLTRRQIREEALRLLELVAIPDPISCLETFSHQLSGGQRQRITIALALAGSPDILVADEPTTALDVTIQSQVLDLLLELRQSHNLAILLITHDLGMVASTCERVYVMYAGQIVESGTVYQILEDPRHPYSKALLEATPRIGRQVERGRLPCIEGVSPELGCYPGGCSFHPRCPLALVECADQDVDLIVEGGGREIRCLLADPAQ